MGTAPAQGPEGAERLRDITQGSRQHGVLCSDLPHQVCPQPTALPCGCGCWGLGDPEQPSQGRGACRVHPPSPVSRASTVMTGMDPRAPGILEVSRNQNPQSGASGVSETGEKLWWLG